MKHGDTRYFITYDAEGTILSMNVCPADQFEQQPIAHGETKLEVKGWVHDLLRKKVVNGKIVDKTAEEMAALRKANPRLRFDNGE